MNKEWLYDEYVIKDRSSQDIADEYGCKQNTIQCWLLKHGIKKKIVKRSRKIKYPYQNKNYLIEQHINKHIPISEIAKNNNVDYDTVVYFLKKYSIDYWTEQHKTKYSKEDELNICNLYINKNMSANKIAEQYETSHRVIINILARNGYQTRNMQDAQLLLTHESLDNSFYDADTLRRWHWDENKSCKEIGEIIGVEPSTVRRQMQRLGIKTKTNSESKIGLMTGENHPNWKGGVTELNELLREYFHTNLVPIAAKRDNYTCQECGKQHTILHVHHIKPFKEIVEEIISEHPDLDIQDNKEELYNIITHDKRFLDIDNLITYCKDCHLYKIHNYKYRG